MISVVIPFFNLGKKFKLLQGCVESTLLQTFKNYEIILVDDGSSDGTSNRVKESIIPKLERTKVSFLYKKLNENKGVSTARNEGLKNAKGDVVVFLDCDDLFLPNYLQYLNEHFIKNSSIWTVSSAFYYFNLFGFEKLRHPKPSIDLNKIPNPQLISFLVMHNFPFPMGSGIAIRRSYAVENGLFFSEALNRETSEDVEFGYRLISHGIFPHFIYKEMLVCRSYYSLLSRSRSALIRVDFMRLYKYVYRSAWRRLIAVAESEITAEEKNLFRKRRWEIMCSSRAQSLFFNKKYRQWFGLLRSFENLKLGVSMLLVCLTRYGCPNLLSVWIFFKIKTDIESMQKIKMIFKEKVFW